MLAQLTSVVSLRRDVLRFCGHLSARPEPGQLHSQGAWGVGRGDPSQPRGLKEGFLEGASWKFKAREWASQDVRRSGLYPERIPENQVPPTSAPRVTGGGDGRQMHLASRLRGQDPFAVSLAGLSASPPLGGMPGLGPGCAPAPRPPQASPRPTPSKAVLCISPALTSALRSGPGTFNRPLDTVSTPSYSLPGRAPNSSNARGSPGGLIGPPRVCLCPERGHHSPSSLIGPETPSWKP